MKKQIIQDIREEKIDINNQELFFSSLIKGLILKLNKDLKIRDIPIPHLILNTGDDSLYLEHKGQNNAIEPFEISNEDYIYQAIPRCIVTPGGIDLIPDQLTNPYTLGRFQYDHPQYLMELVGEYRRMPLKLTVELKYYLDSYRDLLELTQQIITKLSFINTFNITYLGQAILCSYKIPESFSGEYITDLDGKTTENKSKTMSLNLEIETNFPIISSKTVMHADNVLSKGMMKFYHENDKYNEKIVE